jgi:hypothetical protein
VKSKLARISVKASVKNSVEAQSPGLGEEDVVLVQEGVDSGESRHLQLADLENENGEFF